MQTLEVISVNFWQILISLLNLTIIFLIIKKLLFGPVVRILKKRQKDIDDSYENAAKAQEEAMAHKNEWEEKLGSAKTEAADIIKSATENANRRGDEIVAEAKEKADGIVKQAQSRAELERKKAADGIKKEIVEVSAALSEKLLGREINTDDHRKLIDSFIDTIGDGDDGNK